MVVMREMMKAVKKVATMVVWKAEQSGLQRAVTMAEKKAGEMAEKSDTKRAER